MSVQRVASCSLLLCLAAGCAQQARLNAPKPIKRTDGPGGSIHAFYSGGLMFRTANAWFRVHESAYVIVGHLGGDGVIQVLYPETPRQYRVVPANKSLQTPTFSAHYDGAPSLFRFAATPFRTLGASMDSYDGRGHGFIFMIVSKIPMNFDVVDLWDEVEVQDYYLMSDPRTAVRDWAESVARGVPYTLKFASSSTTHSFASYASNAWDCSLLSTVGYSQLYGFWGSWGAPSLWFLGHSGSPYRSSSCPGGGGGYYGSRYYASHYCDHYVRRVVPPPPGTPPSTPPLTPTLTRPRHRPIDEPGPAVFIGRAALARPTLTSRSSRQGQRNIARRPGASDDVRVGRSTRDHRPSTRPTDAPTVTRSRDPQPSTRSAPATRAAPRVTTPRPATPERSSAKPSPSDKKQ